MIYKNNVPSESTPVNMAQIGAGNFVKSVLCGSVVNKLNQKSYKSIRYDPVCNEIFF